ncbi:coiled-coil domain-containing protein 33 [Crotalus adamanteus]|uniref:Coiled-coil domain-containing protein 33 n=1 Tax=Crotalus adamanteus TaxID=8729 RepID=A0AAW1AW16_CROAD
MEGGRGGSKMKEGGGRDQVVCIYLEGELLAEVNTEPIMSSKCQPLHLKRRKERFKRRAPVQKRAGAWVCQFWGSKTTSEEDSKQPAQAVTHVPAQPTYAPTWEERVTVEIDSIKAGEEDVSLTVADKDTKEILAKYNIPVKYLRPFHHYHCALVLPRKKDQTGTKLYASIIRKRSLIPRYAGVNYTGLEVFLKGFNESLAQPGGKVKAVARIVNNVGAYVREMQDRLPDAPAVPLTVVNFPDPVMEDFDVPRVNNHGYPQVSSLGGPPEQPMWNTSFLFQGRDGATAFSDDTALLIEYYKSTPGEDLEGTSPFLGYSVLPLTNRVYRKLAADSSRSGIRVENLPIQDTTMRTTSGGLPAVQLGLQLINSERPDVFLTSSTTNGLPVLDTELVILRSKEGKGKERKEKEGRRRKEGKGGREEGEKEKRGKEMKKGRGKGGGGEERRKGKRKKGKERRKGTRQKGRKEGGKEKRRKEKGKGKGERGGGEERKKGKKKEERRKGKEKDEKEERKKGRKEGEKEEKKGKEKGKGKGEGRKRRRGKKERKGKRTLV